jgi:hypothetical protein
MNTFLQLVAQDIYHKLGDLSRTAVVFPNKRARLFFNEHLARLSDKPMWTPAYLSISELFRELSPYHIGDPIRLVCELYRIFRQETGSKETLDEFYFWGELLISDFDDADKNLVDTERLFSNLQALHDIMDNHDFVEPEQEEAIRQFFLNFSIEHRTQLKERFLSLWEKLNSIYCRYREHLAAEGIAYEGMMYRQVIEQGLTNELPYERYVFVGFNVLNQVETALFRQLADAGKAMFYWDYDRYYTALPREATPPYTHEAGEFLLRNLRHFPNELPEEAFDVMKHPKQIRFLAAPTENAQARYLAQWAKEMPADQQEKENAVVLCNEALLLPILHSIPQEVKHVNITMGFPLVQTPVCSLIDALLALQIEGWQPAKGSFRYETVQAVLKHPYTRRLSDQAEALEAELTKRNKFFPHPADLNKDSFLTLLFTPVQGIAPLCQYLTDVLREVATLYRNEQKEEQKREEIFNQLYRESLFRAYTLVGRLHTLVESDLADIQTGTFRRLLGELLATANIPFHGEPAIGMQIMGVLETRNLDFRRLLMLSVNEGQLPKTGGDSSFIPYNLRKAFGMTTIEYKNAVYAYYFYRLIQRAEEVTLVYNTFTEGLNRGEMSRFMRQLEVELPYPIRHGNLETKGTPQGSEELYPEQIEKTADITRRLYNRYDISQRPEAVLSPSALNCYLECTMRFYYRYVLGLKAPEEVSAEIDNALFGTLFHRAAQLVYEQLAERGQEIRHEDLERLLKEPQRLKSFVHRAFKEKFFHLEADELPEYNGTQLINANVITSYLRQLLERDLNYAPFRIVGMEQEVAEVITVDTPHGKLTTQIGGTIDRMDSKEDTLRIVDYKTGGTPKEVTDMEQLFTPADGRPSYIFQTFLYSAILCRKQSLKVAPSLLYIHKAAREEYSPVVRMGASRQRVPVNNFAFYEEEFRLRLGALLNDIFGEAIPFTRTNEQKKCEYCDFKRLCRR